MGEIFRNGIIRVCSGATIKDMKGSMGVGDDKGGAIFLGIAVKDFGSESLVLGKEDNGVALLEAVEYLREGKTSKIDDAKGTPAFKFTDARDGAIGAWGVALNF